MNYVHVSSEVRAFKFNHVDAAMMTERMIRDPGVTARGVIIHVPRPSWSI
jgi:hypothetical protein